jgi:hypothetical protein
MAVFANMDVGVKCGAGMPRHFYRQEAPQIESPTRRNQNIGLKLYIFSTINFFSINPYPNPVHKAVDMDLVSVNRCRDNLKTLVEQVASSQYHPPQSQSFKLYIGRAQNMPSLLQTNRQTFIYLMPLLIV